MRERSGARTWARGDFNIPTVTSLSVAASSGDTTITVSNTPTVLAGQTIVIQPGANQESRVVTAVNGAAKQISFATPLTLGHPVGATVNQLAHRLTDTATWDWNNTCIFNPDNDCTTDPQHASAGASTVVQKLDTTTSTAIHDAAHNPVTVVAAGSTVHDFVTVTGQPGSPAPTGNVTLDFFSGGTAANPCSGPSVTSTPQGPLAGGQLDATGFPQGPLAAGFDGFIAHYPGRCDVQLVGRSV